MSSAPTFILQVLVDATGIGPNTLRVAVVMLLSIPLAIICSLLPASPTSNARHLLSVISTSALLGAFVDPPMVGQLIALALATFMIVKTAPGNLWTPVLVSLISIVHLSIHLAFAQIINPSPNDISAPLMLMVIKLSTYSWAVYYGTLPEEKLSPSQKIRMVKEPPSFLEFLGYSLFFGGFLVGPAIEFSDYRRFTRGEVFNLLLMTEKLTLLQQH
ncbi:lysophospholipid acyltransferase [Phlyctochytrium planicorne]|nr:lysophospholipid acyltransferase [Phlyctochytrium planicorne]